jgi:hypothetical protein
VVQRSIISLDIHNKLMNISIQVSIYITLSSVFAKLLEKSNNSCNIIIIMSVYNVLAKDSIADTQSQLEPRVADDTEASSCPDDKLKSTGNSSVAFSKLGRLESPAIKQDTMPDCVLGLCDSVSETIVSSALGNDIDQLTQDSREYQQSSLGQVAVAAAVLRRQNSVSNSFSGVDFSDWSDDDINYSPLLDEISNRLPLAASDLELSLNADLYLEGIYSDTECIQQLAHVHNKVLLKSNVEWLQTNQNNDQVNNVCGNIDSFHADSSNAAGEESKWSLPKNYEYYTEHQCQAGNYEFDLLPVPARVSLGGEHFCKHVTENRIEKLEKLFLIPTDKNNDFLITPQTLELNLISDSLVSEQVHIATNEEEIEIAAATTVARSFAVCDTIDLQTMLEALCKQLIAEIVDDASNASPSLIVSEIDANVSATITTIDTFTDINECISVSVVPDAERTLASETSRLLLRGIKCHQDMKTTVEDIQLHDFCRTDLKSSAECYPTEQISDADFYRSKTTFIDECCHTEKPANNDVSSTEDAIKGGSCCKENTESVRTQAEHISNYDSCYTEKLVDLKKLEQKNLLGISNLDCIQAKVQSNPERQLASEDRPCQSLSEISQLRCSQINSTSTDDCCHVEKISNHECSQTEVISNCELVHRHIDDTATSMDCLLMPEKSSSFACIDDKNQTQKVCNLDSSTSEYCLLEKADNLECCSGDISNCSHTSGITDNEGNQATFASIDCCEAMTLIDDQHEYEKTCDLGCGLPNSSLSLQLVQQKNTSQHYQTEENYKLKCCHTKVGTCDLERCQTGEYIDNDCNEPKETIYKQCCPTEEISDIELPILNNSTLCERAESEHFANKPGNVVSRKRHVSATDALANDECVKLKLCDVDEMDMQRVPDEDHVSEPEFLSNVDDNSMVESK